MSDKTTASPWRGYGLLTAAEYRNQIIQELIDKAGNAAVYSRNPYGDMELEWDYNVADWLRSQMEAHEAADAMLKERNNDQS